MDTICHEMIHAVLFDEGFRKKAEHDEKLIGAIGRGLASFFMDRRNQAVLDAFREAAVESYNDTKG